MAVFDTPREAFGALRPACVQLTKAQTVENVEQLHARLQAVGEAALQELQEYVLFPLRFALKTPGPKRERVVQGVVRCLTFVLSSTCVKKPDLLLELFSELCLCLASPASPGQLAPGSEELKEAAIRALLALLHSAYGDALLALYRPPNLPQLGFAVSLLLAVARQERARHLKLIALEALQALVLQCDCPEGCHRALEEEEARQCGDLFASFLPGLSVGLCQVIRADVKQGHAVVVAALRLFSRALGLVMADEQLARVPPDGEAPPAPGQSETSDLIVHRGPDWAKSTAAKLSVLVRKVAAFVAAHPHWKARQALVEAARLLVATCGRSLAESVGHLLKALVSLANDERAEVRLQSREVLRGIAAGGALAENRLLADLLAEELHSLATALPRLMSSQDDQGKAATLSLLLGYVTLLGPSVDAVLASGAHLRRLSRALVQVLELDVRDVKVVEERRPWGASGEPAGAPPEPLRAGPSLPRKAFRFFAEDRVFSLLQQVCRALGYYGNLYLLVDHFMALYGESAAYRKQAALVVNELVIGAAGRGVDLPQERGSGPSAEELREVVASVLDEYVDPANWHLATSPEADDPTDVLPGTRPELLAVSPWAAGPALPGSDRRPTVASLNSNIWQMSIQLEGLSCFARALQGDFRPLLISALYPLLEKAGDPVLLISQTAKAALVDTCLSCGYASVPQLINQNADYLVDGISLQLRHRALEPRASRVLEAMLWHSDANVLPLVGDVIQDTLARLDQSHSDRIAPFLGVLHTLMTRLASWSSPGPTRGDESEPGGGFASGAARPRDPTLAVQRPTPEAMAAFFQEYVKQKRIAEGDLSDPEDEEGEEGQRTAPEPDVDEGTDAGESRLPPRAQTAKEVMERCVHLLSAKSLRLRLKVLDILELCVVVLSAHQNALLPLAHRAWPPLVSRLTSDDPLAVLRAFGVLCTLGAHSGDFLRRRFSQDVLPRLAGSLASQAPASARAGPVYSHTLAFKLQLAVLRGLGELCRTLDLGGDDLVRVLEACRPYLSARQPGKLQEAACSVFLHLAQMDPDTVWLFLHGLWCPRDYQPPHPSLAPVALGGAGRKRNEFTDNVQRLLDELQSWEGGAP